MPEALSGGGGVLEGGGGFECWLGGYCALGDEGDGNDGVDRACEVDEGAAAA